MSAIKDSNIVSLAPTALPPCAPTTCVGVVIDWREGVGPIVDYEANPHGPLVAMTLIGLSAVQAAVLIESRRPIVLGFESARTNRPVILGIVQALPLPTTASLEEVEERVEEGAPSHAVIDGQTVSLVGREKIELRCGKSSITLTKSGKVVIRGTHLVNRSSGPNRIRGGSVDIN